MFPATKIKLLMFEQNHYLNDSTSKQKVIDHYIIHSLSAIMLSTTVTGKNPRNKVSNPVTFFD